jgi:hypothetical protein
MHKVVLKSHDSFKWLNLQYVFLKVFHLGVNALIPAVLPYLEACLKLFFHSTVNILLQILLDLQNIIKSPSF